MHFDAFEPADAHQSAFEELLASFRPWGVLRQPSILRNTRLHSGPPAAPEAIMKVFHYLQSTPPPALQRFWAIADGLNYDGDRIVFSTEQFVEENKRMRTLSDLLPFDGLYFIGALGNGDMFAIGRKTSGEFSESVIIWEHETDRRYPIAETMTEYVAKMIVWWTSQEQT